MENKDAPNYRIIDTGYCELQFKSIKQFVDYVYSDMLDFDSYIWRGQRCETWTLEPTLDRLVREIDLPPSQKLGFAKQHLEAFKYATRGRRGLNPPSINDENDWWALGQHHGLPTPFLVKLIQTRRLIERFTQLHQPTVEHLAYLKAEGGRLSAATRL